MTTRTTQEAKAAGAVALVKARYAGWRAAGYPEPILTATSVAAQLGLDSRFIGPVWSQLEAAVRSGELSRVGVIDGFGRKVVAYADPEAIR